MKKMGYFYIALASFLFAMIAIVGKTAIKSGIKAYDLIILQSIATLLILGIYFVIKDINLLKITKAQAKVILVQGIIGSSGTTIFYYMALERMNAGLASMLLFTNPAFISLYFIVSKTKKINYVNNIALILAVIGSALVINITNLDFTQTPVIGLVFGLLASLAYAFFNVYADRKLSTYEPLVITFYTTLTLMLVTLIIHPGFFAFQFELTPNIIGYVLGLAVISGILPLVFLYKGITIIGAERASIVATLELPVTLLLAYFILNEKMVMIQILGVVLIIISIIILQSEDRILGYQQIPNNEGS